MGHYEKLARQIRYGDYEEPSKSQRHEESSYFTSTTYDGLMPGMRQETSSNNLQQNERVVSYKSSAEKTQEIKNDVWQLMVDLFPGKRGTFISAVCRALRWSVKNYDEAKKLGMAIIRANQELPIESKIILLNNETDAQKMREAIEEATGMFPNWWISRNSNNIWKSIENLKVILHFIAT